MKVSLVSCLLVASVFLDGVAAEDKCCCGYPGACEGEPGNIFCIDMSSFCSVMPPSACNTGDFMAYCATSPCFERRRLFGEEQQDQQITQNEEEEKTQRDLQEVVGTFCPMCIHEGMCGGDPHFQTWSGDFFDYHGECDLVFLQAPEFGKGLGMDIHIRTTGRHGYSYIEAAALRIGDDILEVSSYGDYIYNGVDNARIPKMMGDMYRLTHNQPIDNKHEFHVNIRGNENIVISVFKDLVSVNMGNSTKYSFGSSVGLMGQFETGLMLARDGKTVMQDTDAFGQEWQVQENEAKLFQILRAPQHPQVCAPPKPMKESRRLGGNPITHEAAEEACGHWGEHKELCVYDVLAMEDLDVAQAGAY